MNGWITVLLLVVSNVFMTFAWYGQIKLSELGYIGRSTPLWIIIIGSWLIALVEYCFAVPANRLGSAVNGGPYSLVELKVIQEVVSLLVFTIVAMVMFKGEQLHWNHFLAFMLIVAAVYLVFMDK